MLKVRGPKSRLGRKEKILVAILSSTELARFTGCTQEQHSWCNYTGDYKRLIVGKIYEVERVEVHSWHTKVFLVGIKGSFNSVCFDVVEDTYERN